MLGSRKFLNLNPLANSINSSHSQQVGSRGTLELDSWYITTAAPAYARDARKQLELLFTPVFNCQSAAADAKEQASGGYSDRGARFFGLLILGNRRR